MHPRTRPIAFVIASTNHGTMLVNRNDYRIEDEERGNGFGVGFELLRQSSYAANEVRILLTLADCRREHFGDGVQAIDGGANIGVHTIEWSRHMYSWGNVLAFEAQESIFYALAGNIVMNNCFNARAKHAALGASCGKIAIPHLDYTRPASFGSLELRRATKEYIGQPISYRQEDLEEVSLVSIDSLDLARLDLLKLDVEGMESEVLLGSDTTLERHRPIMLIEVIKSDRRGIEKFLEVRGYRLFPMGMNVLAVHESDPTLAHLKLAENSGVSISSY